ncbi:tetratricopeptide repeat protein [Actinomadura craniellae]|uniref:Tetratricopeptide repeat protein n=1 Tax=Actinomadura craniellae TaxID=2231787 RepID=A0A365H7X0_9ACTN|nr:tetratricopeptide repeat protein [Actinomadura craniellae]RAY15066.1 tetratricopeptide repeat protein [Actinomadura craniellae]
MSTVLELMNQAEELPWGDGRTMLVEEALRLAEASDDEVLTFRVRMELRAAYVQGGETAKAFTAFSRCLSEYDRDPTRFDEGDEYRLLWAFKGTVNALTSFPEVPLDRTLAVLDDMERRYRAGGHGLHPVYTYRCVVSKHVGNAEAADRWYAMWHAAPRTRLSDCEGCDPGTKVLYLAWRGRDADALALAEPVLNRELTCSEQPSTILTELLPVFLREGRLEQAADAHRRAYRTQRSRISELWAIATHLEFCAQSGNEARGLEILQRHLGWLDRAPTPHAAMSFAAAGALLLRRLTETEHGHVTVRRPEHGDRPETEVPAAELQAELAERALELAARFDARNRTSHQGDIVRRTLAAEPLVEHLPLTPYVRPATPPPAVPVAGPDPVTIDDPDALLDLAEEHWRRRAGEAALAAWRRFDGLAAEPTPLQRARRADGRGLELLLGDGDVAGALTEWERAIELHAAAGDEPRRWAAASRVAALRVETDEEGAPEALRELEAAADHLTEHFPGTLRAVSARQRLATAHTATGRPDLALKVLDGTETGDPVELAELDLLRAQALIAVGEDREGALGALRRAGAGFRTAGVAALLSEASLLLGQLLDHSDEDESAEALAGLTEAIGAAGTDPRLRVTGHAVRGALLLARERYAEAADDLVEAVAGFTAAGAYPPAAYARVDLGAAYLNAGRPLDAAEALEEAIPVLVELDDAEAAVRARFLLANALRGLGEGDEAAEAFTALAGDVEHPGLAGQCHESAAEVLTDMDRDGQAAERFAAAAEAFRAAGDEQGTVRVLRRRGMCLLWSQQGEAGLAEIAAAHEVLAGWPDEPPRTWETALLCYDGARILAALERPDEALASVDQAVAGFTALGEDDAAAAAGRLRAEIAGSPG